MRHFDKVVIGINRYHLFVAEFFGSGNRWRSFRFCNNKTPIALF